MTKKSAFIFIALAGICWGTSGVFAKLLAPYGFSSLGLTAVRGVVSFLCVLLYALIRDRSLFRVSKREFLIFLGIGLALFTTGASYFVSLQRTSIATAVILMYSAPVLVAVYSALFLGERFSRMKLVSVFLMLLGCVFASGVIGDLKVDVVGVLFGLLSAVAFASYNILTKIAMQKGAKPLSATLYGFFFMAAFALVLSEPRHLFVSAAKAPTVTWPLMIALGIVTFVIPYVLYTYAMKSLPAGTACALGIIEPMAATVFGILFFQEALTFLKAVGIILVLLAVFLLGKAQNKIDTIRGNS